MQDVIFDRAWQISNQAGNLGSILVNGFSISSSQSTVAGQPTQTGAYALQTELVLTANAPAAFAQLTNFLNTSGLFSNGSTNFLVGGAHDGYQGNYRQSVLFNSMQIETAPSTSEGQYGQITIDIDPFNPAGRLASVPYCMESCVGVAPVTWRPTTRTIPLLRSSGDLASHSARK